MAATNNSATYTIAQALALEEADAPQILGASRYLISASVVLALLASFVTIQRFYIRVKYARTINQWVYRFGWIMPACSMLFVTSAALNIAASVNQIEAIERQVMTTSIFGEMLKISSILYFLCAGLVKLSVYSHFNPPQFWAKSFLNWLVIIFCFFCMIVAGYTLLPCGTRAGNNANGACQASHLLLSLNTAWSAFNTGANTIMLCFAAYEIWLALETRMVKVASSAVTVIGAIGVAASAARIMLLFTGDNLTTDPAAQAYQTLIYNTLATVEIGFLTLAGCMISLRPLVSRWLGEEVQHFSYLDNRPYTPRPDTSATTKSYMTGHSIRKPVIATTYVIPQTGLPPPPPVPGTRQHLQDAVEDWNMDPVERRRKRLGLYVSAKELEGRLSPAASPLVR